MRLSPLLLPILASLVLVACSNEPPRTVIEPIDIDSIQVFADGPSVQVEVSGIIGDGCSQLDQIEQERTGETVTVTITRQRITNARCDSTQNRFEGIIRLEGDYPPGEYTVVVNGVEERFTRS